MSDKDEEHEAFGAMIHRGLVEARHNKEIETVNLYKQALQDILKASTVGEMIKIADRVLKEN